MSQMVGILPSFSAENTNKEKRNVSTLFDPKKKRNKTYCVRKCLRGNLGTTKSRSMIAKKSACTN